jgi:hypothetical protein
LRCITILHFADRPSDDPLLFSEPVLWFGLVLEI